MIARVIELCARNRFAVLLAVAVALAGAVFSIRHARLDALPDLGDPQVIVYTEWMGRSPTLVEQQITYPLVSALMSGQRITAVRGQSMFGMSFVHVLFEEGTELDWARSRVLEALAAARGRLPADVSPALGPAASSLGWAFQYTLVDTSGRSTLYELRALQDFTLRYALGQVQGVAEVASVGGFARQYQVAIDPARLHAHGVTMEEVVGKIRASSGEAAGSTLELAGREYFVRGSGYVKELADLEGITVRPARAAGAPVRIKDLGTVRFGQEARRGLLDWNGAGEAVGGVVVVRSGENVLDVIGRVKQKIAALERTMPPGVKLEVAYDRTDLIGRSIDTLKKALLEEGLVVALVVLFFLMHVRSALLPILSLPIAVALAFIPMALLDIPCTIMSLGGIAIAIGATVDAEIAMVEASHRKLADAPPGADRQALLTAAAREVTPALFFSLLVIAAAFLPVFALTGEAGRLFRPLAWTKTLVMLSAALVSITLAPALRDLLLRGKMRAESQHPVSRAILRLYKPFVFVALRNPKSTVALGLLAVLSAIPLALGLGQELMPPLDEGDLLYMPTTLPGISLEEAGRQLRLQDSVLRGFPEVASVFGKVGRAETATDPAPLNMVETTVRLKPRSEWRMVPRERWYSSFAPAPLAALLRPLWPDRARLRPDELTSKLNEALQFAGFTNSFTMPIKGRLDMLSTGVRSPVGIKIRGNDLAELEKTGVALEALLQSVPGTGSALYERTQGGLYVDMVPDREALARNGLTVRDLQRALDLAVGSEPIATTVEGRARFSISARYRQELRKDLGALAAVLVPVHGAGGSAPLDPRPMTSAPAPSEQSAHGAMMGSAEAAPRAAAAAAGGQPLWQDARPADLSGLSGDAAGAAGRQAFVPLGSLAQVRVTSGPAMIRDEGGQLVGHLYVELAEGQRDAAAYVRSARRAIDAALAAGTLALAPGQHLDFTGQYEEHEKMVQRMRLVVPLTLLLVALLLFLHFKSIAEVLIVLLSIPFALCGSIWLLWALDYRVSTAVWVGLIALVGLAAQTGIVMIVYIDNAYQRRKRAGQIRNLSDIIAAHLEGTVQRVRPKLMTVATMLAGLLPLLWAQGSGSDVMRRIAAPMVGGLVTSAFLTLEIIPVVYTYWRYEELLWERLAQVAPDRLAALRLWMAVHAAGWVLLASLGAAAVYLELPASASLALLVAGVALLAVGGERYLRERPAAKALVWPGDTGEARLAA